MENDSLQNPEESENLRMQNELRKARMSLEKGARFGSAEDAENIDPVLEKRFLDYVESFEAAYENAKSISLFDFLGKPDFTDPADLNSEETEYELLRLYDIFEKNGVNLNTLCPVEPAEIYRFIVKELFLHEIDDIRLPGMILNFIYEEFHPNHEYDIKRNSKSFLTSLFGVGNEFYFNENVKDIEEEEMLKSLRASYDDFSDLTLDFKSVMFDNETAIVVADIEVSGKVENTRYHHLFKGECVIKLAYRWEYWNVTSVKLPKPEMLN
ncbi:MAG: hypothetical protein Q8J88_15975 [Bacteroidales bacterium]|nr:hypothetical protein [Bacteroidales bacterium]